ncbi:peroxide stress protein YaaA [Chitinimonas taiwanensis]|uniref:peroxide stress protein YaaA n=1 Tax=Chitinimonas taiwanensis TaxID=240412 RepID=UPI0035B471A0
MLFTLSPAKTLDFATPVPSDTATLPRFTTQSAELIAVLREQNAAQIGSLMHLSAALAELNVARYQQWSPQFTPQNSKPAVHAFMGDVYEGLHAASLSEAELAWAQDHLRILSGLYGVLRPLDLMQPYRLEMGTRLANPRGKNLYEFWGSTLTESLNAELAQQDEPVLVNLASEEYFKSIKRKQLKARLIDCVFEDEKNGQFKIISFYAKRARGLMARFAIQHGLTRAEQLKDFDLDGYAYQAALSEPDRLVFRRREAR